MLFIVKKLAIHKSDVRDSFANLINEVCDDVEVEPCLQTLQGETFAKRSTTTDDNTRLDIKANSFFDSRSSRTFFDVIVFNTYAKSCKRSIPDSYNWKEQIYSNISEKWYHARNSESESHEWSNKIRIWRNRWNKNLTGQVMTYNAIYFYWLEN